MFIVRPRGRTCWLYVVHGLSFIDYRLSLLVSIVYHLKRDVELRARQEHGRIVPCLRFRVQDSGFRVQGSGYLFINNQLWFIIYCSLCIIQGRGSRRCRTPRPSGARRGRTWSLFIIIYHSVSIVPHLLFIVWYLFLLSIYHLGFSVKSLGVGVQGSGFRNEEMSNSAPVRSTAGSYLCIIHHWSSIFCLCLLLRV